MRVLDLVHPDFQEIARRMSQETCDLKIVTKSGELKWVEVRSEKLKLQEQEMLLGNAVDITHRVESEQALRESEQKFRLFFERSSDPMLLLDEKGFFDCNAAAIRQLGVNHKDEVLVHPSRLSPEFQPDGRSSLEKADEMVARAFRDGFHRFEWLHCDLAGNRFWADVSLTAIPFEHRDILFVVWRDITAFKELEDLLREEREQLLVTLRSIGDAVITTDLKGRIVLMNRVAEQLTGWAQEEARGREVDEILDLVDPESGRRADNPLRQAITQGVVLEFTEGLLLHSRDGRVLKVADSASPIRDEKSRIIGGVLVFRDITERERMQEEVFKLRKLESVGRLAGGIAHDFNNLLTGIMGNIEIALLRCDSRPDNGRENLAKALKAANRAADLTQKLLTFAKGGEPIKESANIAEIIRDSAEFPLLGSNIALDLVLPDDLWAAEVDAGQISQVIQNLVINAVHAMPAGGKLSIRAENLKLRPDQALALSLEAGFYVRITIRDQGCGIPEQLYDRIFDPFFTTRQEGSGLGLSVVHSIVNKHGGCIMVSSKEGSYAEFTIYLPALGRVPENIGLLARRERNRIRGCRVLIMDDEEMVLEILGDALASYGCEVTAVRDGREALECYRKDKFDLVIIDLTIPGGLGGRETIKRLREYDPGVKAVVSSGYANDPVLARYEDYGFCGRLEKPFVLEDLFRLLDRILATR
jgi:PAS domain S-box-containing protein